MILFTRMRSLLRRSVASKTVNQEKSDGGSQLQGTGTIRPGGGAESPSPGMIGGTADDSIQQKDESARHWVRDQWYNYSETKELWIGAGNWSVRLFKVIMPLLMRL